MKQILNLFNAPIAFTVIVCLFLIQQVAAQRRDLYLHQIHVIDSTGRELNEGWKIGVNGVNLYTYVTPMDINIVITIDEGSSMIVFYKDEIITSFHISDLNLFCKTRYDGTSRKFNPDYENDIYIQFANENCNEGGAIVFGENVNATEFRHAEDPWGLSRVRINPCDHKICFFGNSDFNKATEGGRYRRINPLK